LFGGGGSGTDEGRVGRWASEALAMSTRKLPARSRCVSFMAAIGIIDFKSTFASDFCQKIATFP
jgi:hypothetical protein